MVMKNFSVKSCFMLSSVMLFVLALSFNPTSLNAQLGGGSLGNDNGGTCVYDYYHGCCDLVGAGGMCGIVSPPHCD